jgi:hypothetical protein
MSGDDAGLNLVLSILNRRVTENKHVGLLAAVCYRHYVFVYLGSEGNVEML